jgi:opacity protein-like surface antigen
VKSSFLKQTLVIAGAALAFCTVPSVTWAQSGPTAEDGWYLGLNGGVQHRVPAKDALGAETVFKNPGFDLGAVIGHRWHDVRLEAELLYINNNNAREIVTGAFDEEGQGNIGLRVVLANVIYQIGGSKHWRPYLGAGVGFFHSEVHGLTSPTLSGGVPGFFGPTVVDTTSRETPGWDFKAGIGYTVSDKTELTLGTRYFRGNPFRLDSATLGELDVNGAKVASIEGGFRVRF